MLPEPARQAAHRKEQSGTQTQHQRQHHKKRKPQNIQYRKEHQQKHQPHRQIGNIDTHQPIERDRPGHPLVDLKYTRHHSPSYQIPKKDFSTVATTTRKIQEPNQEAATLLVSGSPAFHLLNTFTAPTIPTTAPMAYIRSQPASK